MRRSLSVLIAVLLLAALFYWFGLGEVVATLRRASPAWLAVYLALTTAVLLAYSSRWWLVTRTVGAPMPIRRCFGGRLAGDAVGSLVPSAKLAGEPVRIALVRAGGAPLAAATAGVALDRMLELIGNTVAVLTHVGIFTLWHATGGLGSHPLAVTATMLLLLGALFSPLISSRLGYPPLALLHLDRVQRIERLKPWLARIKRLEAHLEHVFLAHPRIFVLGVLASIATEAVIVAEYHTLLRAFGIVLDLPTVLLVVLGGGLSRAMPTPGGLGALEATQTLLVGAASGQPDLGFVIGVIVRLHETLLLGLGLGALAVLGMPLAGLRWRAAAAQADQ